MKFLFILFCVTLFSACDNSSSSKLEELVKSNMLVTWEKEGIQGIEIIDLTLNLVEENNYTGVLETLEDGERFIYPIKVVVNGDSFEWEVIGEENPNNKESLTSTTCSVCGESFSGNGYEEQIDGSWMELDDNHQGTICSAFCGRKNIENLNEATREIEKSNSTNNGDYYMGEDGKVYENNSCSLCKGTGIETGRNLATGETEGRICPMCDGKGVRIY